MYPKVAPEWYRKMVSGMNMGNVHVQPAPEGSMLLLGHISLAVPEAECVDQYWISGGLQAGQSCQQQGQEVLCNFGPSQCRFPVRPGQPPQLWPGEISVWVEDIRATTDNFNMLGQTLGTDLVNEYKQAETGGEYMLKLKDPFRQHFILVSECPKGWAAKLRAIGHDPSTCDTEYPPKTLNPLAIIDATVLVPSRAVMEGACRFYRHYLLAPLRPPGPSQYSVEVHFGPGEGLHQTLTYRQDPGATFGSGLGSVCLYLRDRSTFIRVYARCKAAGILREPPSREEADRACEFRIRCVHDPESQADLVPLEHVVRHAAHPDCPIHPGASVSRSRLA